VCGGAGAASGKAPSACALPKTQCGTRCVDTATAPRNCGRCGVVCEAGQVCRAGACSKPL
jgi:hypothetical protein